MLSPYDLYRETAVIKRFTRSRVRQPQPAFDDYDAAVRRWLPSFEYVPNVPGISVAFFAPHFFIRPDAKINGNSKSSGPVSELTVVRLR